MDICTPKSQLVLEKLSNACVNSDYPTNNLDEKSPE
jgi:hypothetical protein